MTSPIPYAEVIGDPIGHSKSPLIHSFWLEKLGIEASYHQTRVAPADLGAFLARRRWDPLWRGCNVTIPHKEEVISYVDGLDANAFRVGAVNCILARKGRLTARNSDIDGIAAAIGTLDVRGRTAVMIGAGGAARAAACWLAWHGVGRLQLLVRDPAKAESLRQLMKGIRLEILPLHSLGALDKEPVLVINASPLGMRAQPAMPSRLLKRLSCCAPAATFFDMVYAPLATDFLEVARAREAPTVDGLTMLIGQAARAFELFYGTPPPAADAELRDLLVT